MAQYVVNDPAAEATITSFGVSTPLHYRAAITNTARNIYTCITALAATTLRVQSADDPTQYHYPRAMKIGLEAGTASDVYITWDGVSVPTTQLGFKVPVLPDFLRVPVPSAFLIPGGTDTGAIRVVGSVAGPVYAQVQFELGPPVKR